MEPIIFCDLYGQYERIKNEINKAIQEVILSAQFVKSNKIKDFEKNLEKYLDVNVITCGNGTDALQLSYMALGLKPGDEVITSPFTFVSTVETLALFGIKAIFADVNSDSFNIDPESISAKISPQTKAILPVHLFGQCAHLEPMIELAKKYDLFLIEDACQALGTDYIFSSGEVKKAGTIGHIGCTSFFPSKNLGAFGDGGAVFTPDKNLAVIIKSLANHGMSERYKYDRVGINSRLDTIQAVILDVKLKYFKNYLKSRQSLASLYDEYLKGIEEINIPLHVTYSTHSYHQYTIKAEKRNELKEYLKNKGIPTMIYYPEVLYLQNAYKFLGYKRGCCPVSEDLVQTVLALPMHTELQEDQVAYIAQSIKSFYSESNVG